MKLRLGCRRRQRMENKELTLGSLFSGSGGFELGGILAGIKPVFNSEIEPFPIRVTEKRLPFVKHYGDVSQLNGGDLEPVDIITFGSPCFPAGTLVLTEKGYIPIEEVKAGMKVLTHLGRWRIVTAAGSKTGETVLLRGNHYGLECTPNHPIYSSGEKKNHANRIVLLDKTWIPAGEMKGKLWAVPAQADRLPIKEPVYSGCKNEKPLPEYSRELFYFVGRWLGDGWVYDGQRPDRPEGQFWGKVFVCDSLDKENELAKIVGAISERYTVTHDKATVRFSVYSSVLCNWLTDNFGRRASGKTMPGWVFGMKEEYRAALLQGIFDSDGYRVKGKDNTVKISTISKQLAESIRLLGEIQGFSTTVFKVEVPPTCMIEGRTVNQHDYYVVAITKGKTRTHLRDDLHGWYRVRSVTPTGRTATVYNLTVDEDNSYVADGIVVHNCQDMSIAGKRSGLEGERSGLFHQAIRIVKEMRKATDGKYPRYLVWENVPGAFSSNNGEDFRTVLEELVSIRQEGVSLPRPKEWTRAGEVMGDGFSIAWRVLDAVNWGVPQRRKRIYLVADLDGGRAGKILFESEGMSRYSAEGFKAWQKAARDPRAGAPRTGSCRALCLNDQGGNRMDVTEGETTTLRAESHHPPIVLKKTEDTLFENHAQDSRYRGPLKECPSLTQSYGTGGNNQPLVVSPKTLKIRCGKEGGGKGALIQDNVSATLGCNNDQTLFQPKAYGICSKSSHSMMSDNPESGFYEADSARTLDNNGGNPSCNQGGMAVVALEGNGTRPSHRGSGASDSGEMYTLNATEVHGVVYTASKASFFTTAHKDTADTLVATDYKDPPLINEGEYIVRRLTPTECARLQGFSDWWCSDLGTDDPSPEELEFWKEVFETHRRVVTHAKKPRTETQIRKWLKDPHTDSAEYKMWGNGVALPCVFFVLAGIAWADGCQE